MKRLLTTLIAGLALFAIVASPASASHSWGGYHWARTANPFSLNVGNNVAGSWNTYLATANADWSVSSVMDLASVPGSANKRCAMTVGTVQVCNGTYGNNGWLGLATINITGGTHITQGSAKMNDTYFNTAKYNNPNEKLHVICQEIGHTFGQGHTSEDGSSQNTCMDYFSNTGANATNTVSTHPNQHDYDQLASIYAHLDSSSTLAPSAPASTGMAGRAGALPYRTERSDDGNHSVIVERFIDGSARVTDVLWADGPRAVVSRG
jgi:hypothetical protein